jgi:hypothetical protein
MGKFILKAGIIEAIQFRKDHDANISEVQYFFNKAKCKKLKYRPEADVYTLTLWSPIEGNYKRVLNDGEYILRHLDGSYEVMSAEQFKIRYERVSIG